jgi:transcription elongation factor GreB
MKPLRREGFDMSKAFTKETDDEDDEPEQPEPSSAGIKNYVTPGGYNALQDELRQLLREERPNVVETVRWAAGNGDRSENGDYIYGKRRLREIDRRVRYLSKRIDSAIVVNPEQQKSLTKAYFGATVTYSEENGELSTVQIVGIDEADLSKGKISWISPVAKALLKSEAGDSVTLRTPVKTEILKIISVKY